MKIFVTLLLFLVLAGGCSKKKGSCPYPSFGCLQGKWIEKINTDSSIKEYIQVYVDSNTMRETLFDATAYAQLQTTPLAIGYYNFEEIPQEDSVALSAVWQKGTYHWYIRMVSDNEIEVDYGLPPGPYPFKKRYIRQ